MDITAILILVYLLQMWLVDSIYRKRQRQYQNDFVPKSAILISTQFGWNDEIARNCANLITLSKEFGYELVFVTQYDNGKENPAYQPLLTLTQSCSWVRVLINGASHKALQYASYKSLNVRYALQSINPTHDFIIFVDNDAMFSSGSLKALLKPFQKQSVWGTSGLPYVVSRRTRLIDNVLTGWSNMQLVGQGVEAVNVIWGGFGAIRNIPALVSEYEKQLAHAVSDDTLLARLLKKYGHPTVVSREAIATKEVEGSWSLLFDYTNRQIKYCYHAFYKSFIWAVLFNVMVMFSLLITFFTGHALFSIISYLFLIAYPFSIYYRYRESFTSTRHRQYHRWTWLFCIPLIVILYGINFLCALFSNKVIWSGYQYHVRRVKIEQPKKSPLAFTLTHPNE